MLIDTHAHLWFDDYTDDLDQVLARAKAAGVEKMIVPGTEIESSKAAIELAKKYPGVIYASVGVHPEEVLGEKYNEETPPTFGVPTRPSAGSPVEESPHELQELIMRESPLVVAIGEIGTDGSTEELKSCMAEQKILFREQCELALEFDLPVIIHTRDSFPETWEVLSSLSKMPRGQFHCFSVDEEALNTVIEAGFYVSFCGNITWSKRVARIVAKAPINRLLLETDSPLMVPRDKKGIPIQGKNNDRNEPANVRYLAQIIAEIKGVKVDEIEKITTENAIALYKL